MYSVLRTFIKLPICVDIYKCDQLPLLFININPPLEVQYEKTFKTFRSSEILGHMEIAFKDKSFLIFFFLLSKY
jgi:hypothetical protein